MDRHYKVLPLEQTLVFERVKQQQRLKDTIQITHQHDKKDT
jgi:hypothetical protein